MKQRTHQQIRELANFAERALAVFAKNPELASYSDGNIEVGGYLALRWGLTDKCALVVRIDPDFDPVIFTPE